MINPESRFRIAWDAFIMLLTIIVSIQAPLMIVFEITPQGWLYYLDLFITSAFSADIVINFCTAKLEKNRIENDFKKVAGKYLKGWFWIDFIATIPFDIIFSGMAVLSLGRLFRIFRLARLLRLVRIAQTMRRVNSSNIFNPSILRLIFLVFWIAFAAHFIACGWIMISGNPKDLDDISRYIRAVYWTITTLTTIGYGDITPANNIEIIYVIFIEIMGAGMYGFIIGNIANLIANIDIAKAQYREKMEKINTFMKYRNIPGGLQKRINDYYSYLWDSRRGYDESSVLDDLPAPLKTQVALFLNKDIIEKVPIFHGARQELIREIILNLEPVVFTPGDRIVTKGEVGDDMFFISKGSVDVVSEDETVTYATLISGQFFGEIALLFSSPRTATIKAREYCDLYSLNKSTFDSVLGRYPDFENQIKELAARRRKELIQDQKVEQTESVEEPCDPADEIENDCVEPEHLATATDVHIDELEADGRHLEISGLAAERQGTTNIIRWNALDIPCHYEIIRHGQGQTWRMLNSSLVEPEYQDIDAPDENYIAYKVRAVDITGPGPWSKKIKPLRQ